LRFNPSTAIPSMNCDTETLLLEEVAPRLRAAIPKTVPMVGSDEPNELVQDGLAIAMGLQSAKRNGKKVTPGNIAHYTVLALRSGRRSTGQRKNDVLAPACQLNGYARVQSMDEPIRDGGSSPDVFRIQRRPAGRRNTSTPNTSPNRPRIEHSIFSRVTGSRNPISSESCIQVQGASLVKSFAAASSPFHVSDFTAGIGG
jgi:hypothetical protein